jgi:hypothetical protein
VAQYEPTLLTYFDVLGFREMVKTLDADSISEILGRFNRLSNPGIAESQYWGQQFHNFSDLAVRTVPIRRRKNMPNEQGLLYWELLDLAFIQAELIEKEILIRGAVTVGDICMERGLIFGPALIRAYELESKVATYPRIVIDGMVFERLEDMPELRMQAADQRAALHGVLTQDGDNVWFVDYLKVKDQEMISDRLGYLNYLLRHQNVVAKFLSSDTMLSDVSAKHGWIAHYHNLTVAKLDPAILRQFNMHTNMFLLS